MSHLNDELLVLQAVRLKGRTSTDALVGVLGPEVPVEEVVARLTSTDQIEPTRLGLALTAAGRSHLDDLLADERASVDASAVAAVYTEFCGFNDECKRVVTDWQMVSPTTPNDHGDPVYDAAVIRQLGALHGAFVPTGERITALLPRLRRTMQRLAVSVVLVEGGDHRFIASPGVDSFHSVWFELHEELLLAAGLDRADETAAGRA